ncbi:MAG: precorrin-3B C(17)-methyltransferase [bacterium]|nr:precorrin-3B C(17)-methyltransferase [bacterium]
MKGKIYVVGIGPGNKEHISLRAAEIIEEVDVVIGYKTYIDLLKDVFSIKKLISSGMKKEVERCREALEIAEAGNSVALISSGDAGIYGMAGIMLEVVHKDQSAVPVEVIPGITSSSAAASILGAPLMHDFAVVSLSDLLTDWDVIKKRLDAAAQSDFVLCLYNPKSNTRETQIETAREILLRYKNGATPVGIVKNAMRDNERVVITNLDEMLSHPIDMTTVIIIGNSKTYIANKRMITPRGYVL